MRRTVEVGYSRGEETRARILGIALTLFGNKGYDSVTTREIAQAAAVPPASLRYYFGNKQGLYLACLEHVQTLAFQQMEPALDEAELLLEDANTSYERLIESFCILQESLVDSMIGGADGGTVATFIVRHDLPSEGGAGKLVIDSKAGRRMMACFITIMIRISGGQLDSQSAARVSGLINGQLTNIYVRRNRLAEYGWDITPERLLWLKQMIRKNTEAILRAHRPARDLDD